MKKTLFNVAVILLIGICAFAATSTVEIETPPLKYIINGKQVEMPQGEEGFLYNDRTYVPIRFIAEALDKDVSWDNDTNTVIISEKQPVDYELEDGVLTKNGVPYKIEFDKEITYEKLYNNTLVCYAKRLENEIEVYDVYLYNLNNKTYKKVDIATVLIGDMKDPTAEHLFSYRSYEHDLMLGVINLKTGNIYYIETGFQKSMVWDNDTVYYSTIHDDAVFMEKLGEKAELITNTGIENPTLLLDGQRLICYSYETDAGCIIDLKTKKIVSRELTKAEKNSVVLRLMLKLYEFNEYEYVPEFVSRKPLSNLRLYGMKDGNIILKSSVDINEKDYPKSLTIINGMGEVELVMDVYEENMIRLNLEFLESADKDTITEIISEQIN